MEIILPDETTLLATTEQITEMVDPLICTPPNGSAAGTSICAKEHPCPPLVNMTDLPTIKRTTSCGNQNFLVCLREEILYNHATLCSVQTKHERLRDSHELESKTR